MTRAEFVGVLRRLRRREKELADEFPYKSIESHALPWYPMTHGRQRYSDKGDKTRTRNSAGFIQARSLPATKKTRRGPSNEQTGRRGAVGPRPRRDQMTGRALRQHGPPFRSGGRGQESRPVIRRFRGESVHKVDQKGRVSVPAPFRRVLEEGDPDWAAGRNPNLVLIYGSRAGAASRATPSRAPSGSTTRSRGCRRFSTEREALERLLNTQSVYAQVDENGRIVLPQRLREMFGLGEEALFAGMGEQFQVWAPDAYAADMAGIDDWRDGTRRRRATRSRCSTRLDARGPVMMMAPVAPHVPVLLAPILRRGGAGARASGSTAPSAPAAMRAALLDAGAARVIGIDRDPEALARAAAWAGRLRRPAGAARGPLRRARPDRGGGGGAGARRGGARHRRLVDAARPGGARVLVPEGRAARHADEPGRAVGGGPGQPAAGGARSPTSCSSSARSAPSRRIARAIVADRGARAVRDARCSSRA